MEEPVAAPAPERATAAARNRERVLQLIRAIEQSCAGDPARRRDELNKLRRQFMTEAVANRLAREGAQENCSPDELHRQAAAIIAKAEFWPDAPASPLSHRSRQEERYMLSARVAWHKIIKSEGVQAANPRSSKPPSLKGAASSLRRLQSLRADPELGSTIVHDYVAGVARRLRKVCEDAARLNPDFVRPEIWASVRQLEGLKVVPDRDRR